MNKTLIKLFLDYYSRDNFFIKIKILTNINKNYTITSIQDKNEVVLC